SRICCRCFIVALCFFLFFFFFSSRRRHTRLQGDWSSDVCSSDLPLGRDRRRRRVRQAQVLVVQPVPQLVALDAQVGQVVLVRGRSEERRVGKECRSRWGAGE